MVRFFLIVSIALKKRCLKIFKCINKKTFLDEIGCIVGNDLSRNLFDCWVEAALQEFIPSPSYWRTLATLTTKWIQHVFL